MTDRDERRQAFYEADRVFTEASRREHGAITLLDALDATFPFSDRAFWGAPERAVLRERLLLRIDTLIKHCAMIKASSAYEKMKPALLDDLQHDAARAEEILYLLLEAAE
jgi:hypothetical protein